MDWWLIWVIAGFVLVIAELVTGTFYLLVIGLGAFAAAAVAALGGNALWQALLGSAVALGGAFGVHHWHLRNRGNEPGGANFLDRGQPVVLEGWAQPDSHIVRVKYRGTTWDARLAQPGTHPAPGTTLYIHALDGNTLVVDDVAPAR